MRRYLNKYLRSRSPTLCRRSSTLQNHCSQCVKRWVVWWCGGVVWWCGGVGDKKPANKGGR